MRIYYGETKFKPKPLCKVQCVNVYCHKICKDSIGGKTLEGYVYDACTGKPVRHATVILENVLGREACSTDCRGHYKMYMPCKDTWCKIKIKKHKYYMYYACKLYVEQEQLDFKICPR